MPFDFAELQVTGLFLLKIASVLGMTLYVVFAFIVTRQVLIMTQTLEVNFEKPLRAIAAFHLAASIFVFIFSVVM